MQGKVSQNNEQKDLKIIRRDPNDKHVAFIVHDDSLLCDTRIDLFTEFPISNAINKTLQNVW